MRTEYNHYVVPAGAWVAVNSRPHCEQLALDNLKRQDFVAYCPMVRRRVSHARRVEDKLKPLFPGYLFVQMDPGLQRWRPIASTYGVRALVRCGERLGFLDDGFIQALKLREVDGAIVRPDAPYRVGQQVRLSGGPMDSVVATIIEMREKDRLVVLAEFLNRPVRIAVDADSVAPAGIAGQAAGKPDWGLRK